MENNNQDLVQAIDALTRAMRDGNVIYQDNPYKFSVYRAAAHTSSSALPTTITHDTKLFDTSSAFNTSNGRYTAPVSGYYYFNAMAGNTVASGTIMYCSFFVNGVAAKNGAVDTPTAGNTRFVVSGLIFLNAGDYIDHRFQGGGGSVMATNRDNCYFEGYLVSRT